MLDDLQPIHRLIQDHQVIIWSKVSNIIYSCLSVRVKENQVLFVVQVNKVLDLEFIHYQIDQLIGISELCLVDEKLDVHMLVKLRRCDLLRKVLELVIIPGQGAPVTNGVLSESYL